MVKCLVLYCSSGSELYSLGWQLVGGVVCNMDWNEEIWPFSLMPIPGVVLAATASVSGAVPHEHRVLEGLECYW